MQRRTASSSRLLARQRRSERGVALITTLLLLMLLSGLALSMAWSTGSDRMLNGYYGNFRGSFYAADSGLTIGRQALIAQLEAQAPAQFNPAVSPIPAGAEATVIANMQATYGQGFTSLNNGNAASSWPEKYKIDPNSIVLGPAPGSPAITLDPKTNLPTKYVYTYNYSLSAIGQSRGTENTILTDSGNLVITATVSPTSSKQSFAAWGMFIDQYTLCGGGDLVPGTITGPVFTNGAWNFGSSGQYTFTDNVSSVNKDFGFDFPGGCQGQPQPSATSGGTTIAPKFNGGYTLGAGHVALPQNTFSQERAVLDGEGTNNTAPTNAQLNAVLMDVNKNPYPAAGAASGVFLPYTTKDANGNAIPPKFTGGGILVQGDAKVVLSPAGSCLPAAACAQVYSITQGNTTTTITVDPVSNTTKMVSGAATVNITGIPTELDPTSGQPVNVAGCPGACTNTMLYVNGNITSLSGPGQGQPAIQNGSNINVTSANTVTITGDILYKSEPVTLAATQTTPIDTLQPQNDTRQALGIFTANGDIQMNSNHPVCSGNVCTNSLEIDASIAMLCDGSGGCNSNIGLTNTGAALDQLTIVGGRIQNQIKNINTTVRNVLFDRRYASGGFAPCYFPSTTVTPGTDSAQFLPATQNRTSWLNQTSMK